MYCMLYLYMGGIVNHLLVLVHIPASRISFSQPKLKKKKKVYICSGSDLYPKHRSIQRAHKEQYNKLKQEAITHMTKSPKYFFLFPLAFAATQRLTIVSSLPMHIIDSRVTANPPFRCTITSSIQFINNFNDGIG